MGMFSSWLGGGEAEDYMARSNTKPLDTAKIDDMVRRLRNAVRDANSFRSVQESIAADKTLSAQEVIAIASSFAGGVKAKSKKAALTAIGQERVRVSHAKAKGESAAKNRAW
jgi:hypothetical protein